MSTTTTTMTKKEEKTNKKEVQDTLPMAFKSQDPFYEDLTDFEKMIWRLMKANKGVVNLISPPGFGKTAFTEAFAKKIGLKFIDLHLTTYEDNDVAGMPRIRVHNGYEVMYYAVPEWAVLAYEAEEGSLTLMDEANRCKISVMNASLRVLNEKKIGYDFHFKPNDYFILTGNIGSFSNQNDGAEVNVFDSAMLGRLYQVNLLSHLKEWNDHWFKVVGPTLSKPLFNYLKANPHMLHQYTEGDEGAYPSHRSNTNLSAHFKANLGEEKMHSIPNILSLKDDFSMIIGTAGAIKFISYLEDLSKISGLTVLNSFNDISVLLEQYSKAQHQELLDDIKNFRFQDITQVQSDNLKAYLTFLGETLGLDEVVAGMWDFLIYYDMPDYDAKEDEREQEHLVKMKSFGFMTPYFNEILTKLMPDLPFEIVDEE